MTERRVGQFSFQNDGSQVNVSLHEDPSGWPSIATEIQGETRVHERGASFEEVMILGLGSETGLRAIKAYRKSGQNT